MKNIKKNLDDIAKETANNVNLFLSLDELDGFYNSDENEELEILDDNINKFLDIILFDDNDALDYGFDNLQSAESIISKNRPFLIKRILFYIALNKNKDNMTNLPNVHVIEPLDKEFNDDNANNDHGVDDNDIDESFDKYINEADDETNLDDTHDIIEEPLDNEIVLETEPIDPNGNFIYQARLTKPSDEDKWVLSIWQYNDELDNYEPTPGRWYLTTLLGLDPESPGKIGDVLRIEDDWIVENMTDVLDEAEQSAREDIANEANNKANESINEQFGEGRYTFKKVEDDVLQKIADDFDVKFIKNRTSTIEHAGMKLVQHFYHIGDIPIIARETKIIGAPADDVNVYVLDKNNVSKGTMFKGAAHFHGLKEYIKDMLENKEKKPFVNKLPLKGISTMYKD